MLVMCAEKVLRLASIDCSSPMSAKSDRNTGRREPSAAGMRRPDCAIRTKSPAVFSATVLPPVFGPVTSSTVAGGITLIVTGTRFLTAGGAPPSSSQPGRRGNPFGPDRGGVLHQRMPRRLQFKGAVARQRRLDAVHRFGKARPR